MSPRASRYFGCSVQSRILLADAAFAGADELNEVQNFRQRRQVFFHLRERVGNGKSFAEQTYRKVKPGYSVITQHAIERELRGASAN